MKVDVDEPDVDTKCLQAVSNLKQSLPRFARRAVHHAFTMRYNKLATMTASMRRDVFKVVFGDCSSGSHAEADKARDARLQCWLEAEPEDAEGIVVDLRKLNTRATSYDRFWEVMSTFLDEKEMKVNARRHGTTCEVPIAWSMNSLITDIREYAANSAANNNKFEPLTDDEVPSEQWVRMSFCPSNPWVHSAKYYNCKFDVRFRLLSSVLGFGL